MGDALMKRLNEIISDEEIARVHGNANFGSMTPREVLSDGVRKVAVGYHTGHTQFCILREHGLITKPRPGSYDASLTKKGKEYARALYAEAASRISELEAKLATAADILEGAPVLFVDCAMAKFADDKAALEYARLVKPWAEQAQAFLASIQERT